jgi:hypothetical protein
LVHDFQDCQRDVSARERELQQAQLEEANQRQELERLAEQKRRRDEKAEKDRRRRDQERVGFLALDGPAKTVRLVLVECAADMARVVFWRDGIQTRDLGNPREEPDAVMEKLGVVLEKEERTPQRDSLVFMLRPAAGVYFESRLRNRLDQMRSAGGWRWGYEPLPANAPFPPPYQGDTK